MDDRELDDEGSPRAPQQGRGWWIALTLAAILAAGGAFLLLRTPGSSPPEPTPVAFAADAGVAELDGGTVPSLPLADGDALLRKLAAAGSSSAELAGWLAAPDILRRIAASIFLMARGDSPRPVLGFVEIEGEFAVKEESRGKKGERILISPASYARYDRLTRALTSIDGAYAGQAYGQLRPYFDSAFAEVGHPGERFDDVLRSAIRRLVSVQVSGGEIELVEKGAIYAFRDPALESLRPLDKHMLRLGPANAAAIQASLRRFAEAAGLSLAP